MLCTCSRNITLCSRAIIENSFIFELSMLMASVTSFRLVVNV